MRIRRSVHSGTYQRTVPVGRTPGIGRLQRHRSCLIRSKWTYSDVWVRRVLKVCRHNESILPLKLGLDTSPAVMETAHSFICGLTQSLYGVAWTVLARLGPLVNGPTHRSFLTQCCLDLAKVDSFDSNFAF